MNNFKTECKISKGNACEISSLRQAVKCFSKIGKKGFVTLESITKPSGEQIICWVCRHQERVIGMLPLFGGDIVPLDYAFMPMRQLKGGELFCYGDYFYRMIFDMNGEAEIRAVMIFDSEEVVRQACALKGKTVSSVELVQMREGDERNYVSGGWLIECEEGNPILIFVDLRDAMKYANLNFEQVWNTTVSPGRRFSANGIWYELAEDAAGRLYIKRSSRPKN